MNSYVIKYQEIVYCLLRKCAEHIACHKSLSGVRMETNEARVYFALDGDDFELDVLTEFLGLEPTSMMRKGSRISEQIPAQNTWCYSSEKVVHKNIDVFAMAAKVIDELAPKKNVIIEAIEKFNLVSRLEVVLCISMNDEHSTPAIGFESETIRFLAEVGAFIDIDTYKQ